MYGNRDGGFRPRGMGGFAPVRVGEEIDVKIEAVGEKGDGIARKKGFVLFVPNTKEGDEVRIKVTKVLRKVGFAEVIGQAQGPIEENEEHERREETQTQEAEPMPEPEPSPEDSENFGEDLLEPEEETETEELNAPEKKEELDAPEEKEELEGPEEKPEIEGSEEKTEELEVPPPPETPEEEKTEEPENPEEKKEE